MSADAITVCPACYSKALGKPFSEVTLDDLNAQLIDADSTLSNELREYHDPYIDQGAVHFEFRAACYECGYSAELHLSAALPEPRKS